MNSAHHMITLHILQQSYNAVTEETGRSLISR